MNIKNNYYKSRWFRQYKKAVLNKKQTYYQNSLSNTYGLDSKVSLFCITFYDTVTNNQMNKLIKKLYKLKNNKKYKVKLSYRKKAIKDLNYIRPQFDCTGGGSVAYVDVLDGDMLKSIEISWSQINNDEAIVEYVCIFKNCIDNFQDIHNICIKNYKKLKNIKYIPFYFDIHFFENDDKEKIQLEDKYFRCILQQKLEKLFYSNYIKKYLLPCKYTYLVDEKTERIMSYISKPFLETSYIMDDNHYLVINSLEEYEGCEIDEFIFKKKFNPLDMIMIFSYQRMNLYYNIFYNIEKAELEYKITKFLNSKKVGINIWDYKWLLNKYRRIDESRFYKISKNNNSEIKGFSNSNIMLSNPILAKNIKKVYKEHIDYFNGINSINYNIITFIISIIALVISIISIIIPFILK